MRYRVTLVDEAREMRLAGEGLEVGGGSLPAELAALPGTRLRHLRLGDLGTVLLARRVEGGWEVVIAGRALHVRVEDERARAIRELAGARAPAGPRVLRAPMPGLIVRVETEPGRRVEVGTPLVVMEAMKMENELRASGPGTVAAVEVRPGQTVDRDAVLVRFE